MICSSCHHAPSERHALYGCRCNCGCHDVADAAPDLLDAATRALGMLTEGDCPGATIALRAAIATTTKGDPR